MQCYPSLVYKAMVHFPFMCCIVILLITATEFLTEASRMKKALKILGSWPPEVWAIEAEKGRTEWLGLK